MNIAVRPMGLLLVVVFMGWPLSGWAKDSPLTDDEVVVRNEGAHRLLLPKDWPVEQRDGRLSPIPLEEYLSMKFGQVAAKFDDEDQRLGALERQLKKLEEEHEEHKVLQQRLRLLEEHEQGRR